MEGYFLSPEAYDRVRHQNTQMAYDLAEMKSEIARHHDLIEELRDGLFWALEYLGSDYPYSKRLGKMVLNPLGYYERLRELLNREVG